MKKFLIAAVLVLFAACSCPADNNNIFPTGPVFPINNLTWGTTGTATGFNNNFVFVPLYPNECISVAIFNNNTTSSHTFQVMALEQVATTGGNPPAPGTGPSANWQMVFTSGTAANSANVGVSPNSFSAFGQIVGNAFQIALSLSGGATQAGSPDTANVTLVQYPGPCTTVIATPQIQPTYFSAGSGTANTELVSAANAAATFTSNGFGGVRNALFSVSARCSAGTAGLTVADGGTTIWSSAATEVGTTTFRYQWSPGLLTGLGKGLTVTLSTCGAANTGTLDVQVSLVNSVN